MMSSNENSVARERAYEILSTPWRVGAIVLTPIQQSIYFIVLR
jgi:hypothetical protein